LWKGKEVKMPIEGVSDVVRIPRLGKIHLGVKGYSESKQKEYPKATDYFVVPEEIKAVHGEKPTELDIMFPVEDPNLFAQQWLRAYSLTQGLICIGDGVNARRKVDLQTGAIADHETKQWEWREITCNAQECPEYQTKRCRRVMNLQFLLPKVPGLGVWQIDTSSFYSIVNINSMIKMLKGVLGRCSMVPLTLALGPVDVSPLGQTKKTVYIMHIKKNLKLAELAQVAQLPPAKVLIPEPETEQPPEDLFPEGVIKEAAGEEEELFPEEEIPQIDEELLKGWQIAKSKVKELKLTNSQVTNWFKSIKELEHVEITLATFDQDLPSPQITNEIISKFVTMLDIYSDRQKEKAQQKEK
jgi:hypothetical protein